MVYYEIRKTLKCVVLFPVHIRFNFTVKTHRYLIFSEALRNAGSASVRVVYRVAAALMVNTGAEWDFHLKDLLV